MKQIRTTILMLVLTAFCLFQSGCALLQIPVKIVEGTFGLLKQVLKIVDKLPKPPPGVF